MKDLLKKIVNKETILYVVFGVVTTIANYAVYFPLVNMGVNYAIANVVAFVVAVLVAYITNKLFVFESKSMKPTVVTKELLLFFAARLSSLIVEEAFLFVTVSLLSASDKLMKIIASIFVIIINYIFSKFVIFKKEKNNV